MGYTDVQSQPVGQFLQGFLKHMPVTGVATAAIAEPQQPAGIRVYFQPCCCHQWATLSQQNSPAS